MTKKLRAAVLGPGNIGIDLMIKLLRSPWLDMVLMAGIDPQSEGLRIAAEKGVDTTMEGIDEADDFLLATCLAGQLDFIFHIYVSLLFLFAALGIVTVCLSALTGFPRPLCDYASCHFPFTLRQI